MSNSKEDDNVSQDITTPSTPPPPTTITETPTLQPKLPEHVGILKEAFPDIDIEVIETILQTQNDNLEASFELLLDMSDPNYQAPIPVTPPMPPRPETRSRTTSGNTYYQQQEEQLRLDEEFAKKLALEEERRVENRRQLQYQQQQQQQQHYQQKREQDNDQDSIFNLQEELPIIKEKMIEAGNAAKKKVLDFYNQIKANTRTNNTPQHEQGVSSSMPTTHAQYRGLPSDDGDDLLTGDISALHLSDYDVYAHTGGIQKETSTPEAQLKADEVFARQLANENSTPVKKSPTVVIAPRSPLEFDADSDYEDVGLRAPSTNSKIDENNSVPYVIGDDDDSDSDDLVDIDDDELFSLQDESKDGENKDDESKDKESKDKESKDKENKDEEKKDEEKKSKEKELTKSNENTTTTTTTTATTKD